MISRKKISLRVNFLFFHTVPPYSQFAVVWRQSQDFVSVFCCQSFRIVFWMLLLVLLHQSLQFIGMASLSPLIGKRNFFLVQPVTIFLYSGIGFGCITITSVIGRIILQRFFKIVVSKKTMPLTLLAVQ